MVCGNIRSSRVKFLSLVTVPLYTEIAIRRGLSPRVRPVCCIIRVAIPYEHVRITISMTPQTDLMHVRFPAVARDLCPYDIPVDIYSLHPLEPVGLCDLMGVMAVHTLYMGRILYGGPRCIFIKQRWR